MIPIIKSNKEPENKESIWIDVSTEPAIIFIYKGDSWNAIGTDNQTISEISEALLKIKQDITNSNKDLDNTLKKGSLATVDDISIESKGNIDLTKVYITLLEWEQEYNTLNTKIGQTFTLEQKDLLDSMEEGANATIIDLQLDASSENPILNKVISTKINSDKEEVNNEFNSHTDNQSIHIPINTKEGQFLQNNGDGTASWINLDLTDLLSYGVAWKANVADPDLTRVGNPLLHKSLPILSLIHGCIALCKTDNGKPKIMYWLDKNDWRFRETPEILYGITVNVDENNTITIVNPIFSTLRFHKLYIKIITDNLIICQVTELATENSTATVVQEGTNVLTTGVYNIELGSVLNGYDGEVKNYVPKFYYKSYDGETDRWVKISLFKLDSSWIESKANLMSPWGVTVLTNVPSDMGYLSSLSVNAAVSIVNDSAYCIGGNRDTLNNLSEDIFKRNLNKPAVSITRNNMRNYSRLSGNEIMSYSDYKENIYWLWVIEFSTFNTLKEWATSQELTEPALTSDGYHQGGLGDGVTIVDYNHLSYYNGVNPLTPCGYTKEFGNRTGFKNMVINMPTESGGDPNIEYTMKVPSWRGFNNIFGDYNKCVDGIIIDASRSESNNIVYTTKDPSLYSNDITIARTKYTIAGYETSNGGIIKEFALGESAEIIPRTVVYTYSYKCDYHHVGKGDAQLALLGGDSTSVSQSGLSFWSSQVYVDYAYNTYGFYSSCLID